MASPVMARPLMRGDVVLTIFPSADPSAAKRRPAVVVGSDPAQSDFILAVISSQRVTVIGAGEFPIIPTHPEFAATGLAAPSKVRAGKLATLSRSLMTRWLGRLGPQLTADLDGALVAALSVNTVPYREQGRADERERLRAVHDQDGMRALLASLGLPESD